MNKIKSLSYVLYFPATFELTNIIKAVAMLTTIHNASFPQAQCISVQCRCLGYGYVVLTSSCASPDFESPVLCCDFISSMCSHIYWRTSTVMWSRLWDEFIHQVPYVVGEMVPLLFQGGRGILTMPIHYLGFISHIIIVAFMVLELWSVLSQWFSVAHEVIGDKEVMAFSDRSTQYYVISHSFFISYDQIECVWVLVGPIICRARYVLVIVQIP